MAVPRVVIVGRPNVGKSSIFNWLCGKRIAIVDDMAGVTRDRITMLVEHNDRFFEIVDTGGMGIEDVDNLTKEVEQQIATGIEEADVVLFVVDTKVGLTPLDELVAERLRKVEKPVLLLANKTDHAGLETSTLEFHQLGRGWLIPVSVLQNRNRQELLDEILARLPDTPVEDRDIEPARMKFTIVGRRNVGKSTFVNTLARAERMIVSEVAGTTRDTVDVLFDLDGHRFMAIDTPGLRRNKSIRTDIDFYGLHRAQRSIRRADVVLLFFDCMEAISRVDKQLAHYIEQQFKPCIFVINKWDKVAGQVPTERWVRYLREHFPTMGYAPIAFITGQTGKNVKALLNHAQMLYKQASTRASTAKVNKLIRAATSHQQPPMHGGKRPKIYFASQIATNPPTLIMMCNNPQGFPPSYQRYLLGVLRDYLPFGEVPIKFYLQKRDSHTGQGPGAEEVADEGLADQEFADDEFADDEFADDEFADDEEIAMEDDAADADDELEDAGLVIELGGDGSEGQDDAERRAYEAASRLADGERAADGWIDGEDADASETDGNEADGNEADGKEADGKEADGKEADGKEADGGRTGGPPN
jgi:GTPase